MKERALRVEKCMEEANDINEAYDDLAHIQEQAVFDCYGVPSSNFQSLEISSEELSDSECEGSISEHEDVSLTNIPKDQELLSKLRLSGCNWFEFCDI